MHIFQLSHRLSSVRGIPLSSFVQGVKGKNVLPQGGWRQTKQKIVELDLGLLVAKKKKKKNSTQAPYVKNYREFYLFINVFLVS